MAWALTARVLPAGDATPAGSVARAGCQPRSSVAAFRCPTSLASPCATAKRCGEGRGASGHGQGWRGQGVAGPGHHTKGQDPSRHSCVSSSSYKSALLSAARVRLASRTRYLASSFSVLWEYGQSARHRPAMCSLRVSLSMFGLYLPASHRHAEKIGGIDPWACWASCRILKPWPNCQASWSNEGLC